jgi:hypothetical protein
MLFVYELNFHNFKKKKKLILFGLLATTLLQLGLTFFNSTLALFTI